MATKLKVSQFEAEKIIAPDIYDAEVKSFSFGEGNFGDYVKITFAVSSGAYEGTIKTMLASKKQQKSTKGPTKLMALAETLLGRSLQMDEEFDLETLINKKCRIVLSDPITKDGIQYQKVEKILPSKL
jgi:hypothetical protein